MQKNLTNLIFILWSPPTIKLLWKYIALNRVKVKSIPSLIWAWPSSTPACVFYPSPIIRGIVQICLFFMVTPPQSQDICNLSQVFNASSNILIYLFAGLSFRTKFLEMFGFSVGGKEFSFNMRINKIMTFCFKKWVKRWYYV